MKRVSFDFDGTLEFKEYQDYAKELIEEGIEVWIVTTRYKDPSRYSFYTTHEDLYEVAKTLNISEDHIHFNDMEYKKSFFKKNDFIWHLDDNPDEIIRLRSTNTPGILIWNNNWKEICNKLL